MATKDTKKKSVKKPAPPAAFNFLAGPNIMAQSAEALHSLRAKRKNQPTHFRSLAEQKRNGIPIEHFYLQYALAMAYLPSRSMVEVIGDEYLGKTTLVHTIIGMGARANVPSLYGETEGKKMLEDQIMRCLSPDRAQAQAIIERTALEDMREIRQAIKIIDEWIFDMRGRGLNNKERRLPDENPIMVWVDTASKLMSLVEALGYFDFADYKSADNMKELREVGEGSNMGHAKHFHAWCRRLPYLLDDYNVLLGIVSHKNQKVDMSGRSYQQTPALRNKTKIGGVAFNQNAALQFILAPGELAKNGSGEVTGRYVKLRVDKNSFGPGDRVIEYELRNVYTQDTETSQEQPIQFDEGMAKWFTDQRILGTTAEKRRYTCEALGVIGGDATDLSKALHSSPKIMAQLAKQFAIRGYDDPVEEMIAETAVPPPPPATAA